MSEVAISYSSLGKAADEAGSVAKKLDSYADSIYKNVCKKLSRYDGEWSGNLSAANSRANAKIDELRDTAEKYRQYESDLDDLKETCITVDKAVKSKVSTLAKEFRDAYGIKNNVVVNTISYLFTSIGNSTGFGRWLDQGHDLLKAADSYLKQSIEDWYDYSGGKDLVKGVVTFALEMALAVITVVAAIATGGALVVIIAGVVAGVLAGINAVVNLVNEGRAYSATKNNDPATGKRRSKLNTAQDTLRTETDSKFWHGVATALDITSIVCSVITVGDQLKQLGQKAVAWVSRTPPNLKTIGWGKIWSSKGDIFRKLGTTLSDGGKDILAAARNKNFDYFAKGFSKVGKGFLTNLKKSYTDFNGILKDDIKKVRNITNAEKLVKELFYGEAGGWDIVKTVVVPNISTGEYKHSKDGAIKVDTIKVNEITRIIDGIGKNGISIFDLFTNDNAIDEEVLKKLNSPVQQKIAVPNSYVPSMNNTRRSLENGNTYRARVYVAAMG